VSAQPETTRPRKGKKSEVIPEELNAAPVSPGRKTRKKSASGGNRKGRKSLEPPVINLEETASSPIALAAGAAAIETVDQRAEMEAEAHPS
jgi:hypothetical protein